MMILDELFDKYLKSIAEENKSVLTIRNYKHYLSRFSVFIKAHFPTVTPSTLNLEIISKYNQYLREFRDLKGNFLDSSTCAYHLIALRSFIKYLRLSNLNTINPELIEVPKSQSKPLKFLDNNQIEMLLRLAENKRDKCILELILATGLRVSDLVRINKSDVNFQSKTIGFNVKGNSRSIFLSQNSLYWLKQYLHDRKDDSQALFIRTAGRKDSALRLTVRSVQRIVEKYVKKANLPIKATPHTLRHTFAINLLLEGENLQELQRKLDYKNVVTTQIYTHVTNPQLKEIHHKYHDKTSQ